MTSSQPRNPGRNSSGNRCSRFLLVNYFLSRIIPLRFWMIMLTKRQYDLVNGRRQKSDVIAYQIRQSFRPGEITAEEANKVGYELAMRFTKGKHAFVVATHTDRQHIHNHVIFNSTALDGTRKFRDFFFSALAVQRLSDLICLQGSTCVNFHADWPFFFTQPMPISA